MGRRIRSQQGGERREMVSKMGENRASEGKGKRYFNKWDMSCQVTRKKIGLWLLILEAE